MFETIGNFVSDNIGKFLAGVGVIAIGAIAIDQTGKMAVALKEGETGNALGHGLRAVAAPVSAPLGLVGLAVYRVGETYKAFSGQETSEQAAQRLLEAKVDSKVEALAQDRVDAAVEKALKRHAAANGSPILTV